MTKLARCQQLFITSHQCRMLSMASHSSYPISISEVATNIFHPFISSFNSNIINCIVVFFFFFELAVQWTRHRVQLQFVVGLASYALYRRIHRPKEIIICIWCMRYARCDSAECLLLSSPLPISPRNVGSINKINNYYDDEDETRWAYQISNEHVQMI